LLSPGQLSRLARTAEKKQRAALIDVSVTELHALEYIAAIPQSGQFVHHPGTTEVPIGGGGTS
jgi:hypothetical protein